VKLDQKDGQDEVATFHPGNWEVPQKFAMSDKDTLRQPSEGATRGLVLKMG
jgi:hypothetical protein